MILMISDQMKTIKLNTINSMQVIKQYRIIPFLTIHSIQI